MALCTRLRHGHATESEKEKIPAAAAVICVWEIASRVCENFTSEETMKSARAAAVRSVAKKEKSGFVACFPSAVFWMQLSQKLELRCRRRHPSWLPWLPVASHSLRNSTRRWSCMMESVTFDDFDWYLLTSVGLTHYYHFHPENFTNPIKFALLMVKPTLVNPL